jgi:hypothetical protein
MTQDIKVSQIRYFRTTNFSTKFLAVSKIQKKIIIMSVSQIGRMALSVRKSRYTVVEVKTSVELYIIMMKECKF